jgi:peptidoglycan hydrolase-like protein with peptidoglycan-binding domain
MSGDEPGSFVTRLRSGNEQLVKCPCEIPTSEAPHLVVGMTADQSDTLWIRGLQVMFNDDDPEVFPRSAITGNYDERTAQRVRAFQNVAAGKVTTPGEVDKATWDILTTRLCRHYDY